MNWNDLALEGARVQPGARLSACTTFRLGGACPCLIDCPSAGALQAVVRALAREKTPFILIGGGSNLLVSDAGLEQAVVRYYSETPDIRRNGLELEAGGGVLLDALAQYAVEQGLAGLAFASGIPGTVGGAVAGNAGAFGKQVGDAVVEALLMDRAGQTRWVPAAQLGFAYRQSNLPASEDILVSVRLRLSAGDPLALAQERADVMALRRSKHPDWRATPTAGSFFKNIEPTSAAGRRQAAGWFLEQAGAKEMRVGGARTFDKHANIIITEGPCRAADVMELSRRMAEAVKNRFGLQLEPEVRRLGAF